MKNITNKTLLPVPPKPSPQSQRRAARAGVQPMKTTSLLLLALLLTSGRCTGQITPDYNLGLTALPTCQLEASLRKPFLLSIGNPSPSCLQKKHYAINDYTPTASIFRACRPAFPAGKPVRPASPLPVRQPVPAPAVG